MTIGYYVTKRIIFKIAYTFWRHGVEQIAPGALSPDDLEEDDAEREDVALLAASGWRGRVAQQLGSPPQQAFGALRLHAARFVTSRCLNNKDNDDVTTLEVG